ncbi:hypothetical protein AQULUS_22710 [Aquicella lusitana]|uniref:Uncharacterized protein n=1 Tax=Aquicella lusitana TaxID=254246 RepID=A0A370GMW5_9COXI|nr:hypothetical protein C8D86_11034 [Aquicella lusitana]VVC74505.1 hypothetical protein AQULUS_22710 [Aquicella lusitana]
MAAILQYTNPVKLEASYFPGPINFNSLFAG